MPGIFPPSGARDEARYESVKRQEREYIWFCLEFCGRILAERPHQLEALESAANHFTSLGYYEDGLGVDKKLAELKPRDPMVLYNLACSLALTDNAPDALDALAKAIDLGYADHRHMSIDDDLVSLHDLPRFGELVARAAGIEEKCG